MISDLEHFDDMFDDPSNFEFCSAVRKDGRQMCSARQSDGEDVKNLQCCPNYRPESEANPDDPNIYCAFCWAIGDKSVCEARPKGSKVWNE